MSDARNEDEQRVGISCCGIFVVYCFPRIKWGFSLKSAVEKFSWGFAKTL